MAATNVQFHETIAKLQEIQHASEGKRMDLEHELNSYVKSDQRLAKLKAVRLQAYWKKICEDEKRSQWRNEQLIKDFDRVEAQMAALSARSERLRTMKRQYEEHIERMYPNWKEKIMIARHHKQQVAAGISPGYPTSGGSSIKPSVLDEYAATFTSTTTVAGVPIEHHYSPAAAAAAHHPAVQPHQMSPPSQHRSLSYDSPPRQQHAASHQRTPERQRHSRDPDEGGHGGMDQANHTLQTVSSLPSGYTMTSTQEEVLKSYRSLISPGHTLDSTGFGSLGGTLEVPGAEDHETGDSATSPKVTVMKQDTSPGGLSDTVHDMMDDSWTTPRHASSPVKDLASPRELQHSELSEKSGPADKSRSHDESLHDVSSEHPSSHRNSRRSTKTKTPSPRGGAISPDRPSSRRSLVASPSHDLSQTERDHEESDTGSEVTEEQSSVYPKADVTLDGLYNLMAAVQEATPNMHDTSELYRGPGPYISVRRDIIANANKGATLSHVDPASISMVMLEQLPMVVTNCETGCLLPDKLLFSPPGDINDQSVKRFIHPTCHAFWDKVYEHFVHLIKGHIMRVQELADIFALYLIADDSPYEGKARDILVALLEDVVPEIGSPNSTTTYTDIMSPRGRQQKAEADRLRASVDVPPLDLVKTGTTSASTTNVTNATGATAADADDDFFTQPVPKETSTLPTGTLTQSAAYRRMLGETASTQKTITYEESDDSEDDIERAISRSAGNVTPKATSAAESASQKAPWEQTAEMLSNFSMKDLVESDKDDEAVSEDVEQLSSPAGYKPTFGMGSTNPKSTLSSTGGLNSTGKSDSSKKKPAFMYGDSDTDEDVSIPGAGISGETKKSDDNQDEFDFYD